MILYKHAIGLQIPVLFTFGLYPSASLRIKRRRAGIRKSFIMSLVYILLSVSCFAQKEGLNWYFGENAGLRFHEGYPEPLTDGALSTTEGCSTISDSLGNLLFYTDGITVYNRNHQVMTNGTGLMGDPSATQSGVIVPVPNDTNLFYIFTVSALEVGHPMNGFRYSLIDISLNNGLGAVVQSEKNKSIVSNTTERVTAVQHENEYGVWVIMHEWESSRFRSYLVTSEGISINNPVISDVGLYHGYNQSTNRDGIGYMKVSPDGQKLAVAINGMNLIQVFDFNDITGEIINPLTLPVDTLPYGVEFSAGAGFLYASERLGDKIYQWDMLAGSEQDIINSRVVIGILQNPFGGALQMAADGKIYIARKSKFYLSVINKPWEQGLNCQFEEVGALLSGRSCKEGLPTFIQSYFNNVWILHENQCAGESVNFYLNSYVNIDSVAWNFGDPTSGTADTSTLNNPSHIYYEAGKYKVTVICYHLATQTTLSDSIKILPLPDVELGDDVTICDGDTVIFEAGFKFDTYKWMDNPQLYSPRYSADTEGEYWVEVTNVCGVDYDTVYLTVQPLPEVYLGNDTVIKYNTIIILNAGSNDNYSWQDGNSSFDYTVDYPGTYWVDVYDNLGCKSSDTINIEPIPFQIHVPSAFSPNDDRHNDIFKARVTYDVELEFEMLIYNRWGELVFESSSISEGWDGTYNGIPCPVEVYIWIINAETYKNNAFFSGPAQTAGNVTLIR
ncbi:MAG: gliding motility-associated C-terminal domain-containing protein [Bacteroidetes bacterium]|nr:gliding motility-associated C-terminal domain-containing protein [Bacteroidota bacterium]